MTSYVTSLLMRGEVCEKVSLVLSWRLVISLIATLADMRQWVMVVDRHIDSHGESANGSNGKIILISHSLLSQSL